LAVASNKRHTQPSQAKLNTDILHIVRKFTSFMQQRLAYEVQLKNPSQDCSCFSGSTQEALATLKPKRILACKMMIFILNGCTAFQSIGFNM